MKTESENTLTNVQIDDAEWLETINDLLAFCDDVAAAVSDAIGKPLGEVSLLFCDNEGIRRLNLSYRGKDKPTNVLSFPAGPVPAPPGHGVFLGDIAIARETVVEEAVEQGKPVRDHTAHMIVHGLLHLLGYDHETPEEAEAMEGLELTILGALGIENPYLLRTTEPV